MKNTWFIFALLIPLLYSCSQGHGSESDSQLVSSKGNRTDNNYWLLTDPEAGLYHYLRTPAIIGGRSKLLIFNDRTNTLLIYDTKDQKLETKIEYNKEGPNSINALFPGGGIHYVNEDTLIFFRAQPETLYLSDLDGNIYTKTLIQSDSTVFATLGTHTSLAYKDKAIWMQSWPVTIGEFKSDYENRPNTFGRIDLATGQVKEFVLNYPEVYSGKDFSQQLKAAQIIYNTGIDKFVVSFPLSHEILVTDFSGNTRAHLAKSNLIGEPRELDLSRNDISPSALGNHYYWTNDAYEHFFYDPISGYYFRKSRKGRTEDQLKTRDFNTEKEIVVLDADFRQVATLPHHGGTLMYHFFDGNHIYWNRDFIKYNFERENEDTLYFVSRQFYKP